MLTGCCQVRSLNELLIEVFSFPQYTGKFFASNAELIANSIFLGELAVGSRPLHSCADRCWSWQAELRRGKSLIVCFEIMQYSDPPTAV